MPAARDKTRESIQAGRGDKTYDRGRATQIRAAFFKPTFLTVTLACLLFGTRDAYSHSNLQRLGDREADQVSLISSAALDETRMVTAVRTEQQSLELIVWKVGDPENPVVGALDPTWISRLSSAGADQVPFQAVKVGKVNEISVASLNPGRVVTAVRRQEDGTLVLIAWSITQDGFVQRQGSALAGPVKRLSMAAIGPMRVVTAVQQADDNLKLTCWNIDGSGNVIRLGSKEAGKVTEVAVTALGAKRVVTAVRQQDGALRLAAWNVDGAGNIESSLQAIKAIGLKKPGAGTIKIPGGLGDIGKKGTGKATVTKAEAVENVTIVTAASDRVVTAVKMADGTLRVTAWDVGALGSIKQASGGTAGMVGLVSLTALGTTRVVTAVSQADKTLELITWNVVDEVRRLGSAQAGFVGLVSVVSLGWDRVVTAVRGSNNNLKVIAWNEYAVGLLHTEWGAKPKFVLKKLPDLVLKSVLKQAEASGHAYQYGFPDVGRVLSHQVISEKPGNLEGANANQSPQYSLRFEPGIEGVDPMIAVGNQYLIATQDHMIAFFDKSGNLLTSKYGEATKMGSFEFFSGFITYLNKDGSVNRNNINLHLKFPPSPDPDMQHNPSADSPPASPCMNEFYDTRVAYDPFSKRFLILSAARHPLGLQPASDPKAKFNPIVRRYVAFAISKTEDPRDGFHQYMTTESNYSDWPRMAVNDGLLVVAHNAGKDRNELKPMAYVFSIDDMRTGQPTPRNWKIYPWQTFGGTLVPVIHHGDTAGWTYMVRPSGETVEIYSFKKAANMWTDIPTLKKTALTLDSTLQGFREGIFYRGGKLYMAGAKKITERIPDFAPARWSVRVLRMPLTIGAGGLPTASKDQSKGFLDTFFGRSAPEDYPTDLVSYEAPSMAVNKHGDMIFVYGRVPVLTQQPLFPEARYSVFYAEQAGPHRSRVLREGEYLPLYVHKDETKATVIAYFRPYYAYRDPPDYLDYANAVVDPSDDETFWVTHEFADQGLQRFKMVVGRVKP